MKQNVHSLKSMFCQNPLIIFFSGVHRRRSGASERQISEQEDQVQDDGSTVGERTSSWHFQE